MEKGYERFLEYIEEVTYMELSKGNIITLEELEKWCKELGLNELKGNDSTLISIEYLFENGITNLDFYNRFKNRVYGVHPSRFSNKFKVNNYQRKKMIDTGFLDIIYYRDEEIYPGRIEKVPFLNAEKYFNLTNEDIENWRANNIKGYNQKQLKLEI